MLEDAGRHDEAPRQTARPVGSPELVWDCGARSGKRQARYNNVDARSEVLARVQKVLRAVREERVRHELRAVRAPVGRVRRGLGDEHLSRRRRRGPRVRAAAKLTQVHTQYAD